MSCPTKLINYEELYLKQGEHLSELLIQKDTVATVPLVSKFVPLNPPIMVFSYDHIPVNTVSAGPSMITSPFPSQAMFKVPPGNLIATLSSIYPCK